MKPKLGQTAAFSSMVRIGDLIAQRATAKGFFSTEKAGREPTSNAEHFEGRNGYDPFFLIGWKVPLPLATGNKESDMQKLRRGGEGVELKYRNFSVVMSASRRLPMITACNILGGDSRKEARINVWSFDGRLDNEDQWGDEIYDNNILDRGHMVRREDPIWGEYSSEANLDTFHFTNSCPQVAGVNQKTWLGLENYILSHAREDEMSVSVFTGPFFDNNDLQYKGALIPAAFWKVIAFLKDDGTPSATAYRVSQEKELSELEFVYGAYKTFQISINSVAEQTGIDFGELASYDGFSQLETVNGGRVAFKLENLNDIRI